MKQLFEVAAEVQCFIEARGGQFCFIGGLALQRWGENRLTRDVDLSLFTGFGSEEVYIRSLLGEFPARLEGAFEFAMNYRVLLLITEGGVGIDISLAALPFEEELIARSSLFEFLPGCVLRTCSAEDLVVLKAFAARPQDWVDIRGVLLRQGASLDRQLIYQTLLPLVELKEEPELMTQLEKLCRDVPV